MKLEEGYGLKAPVNKYELAIYMQIQINPDPSSQIIIFN